MALYECSKNDMDLEEFYDKCTVLEDLEYIWGKNAVPGSATSTITLTTDKQIICLEKWVTSYADIPGEPFAQSYFSPIYVPTIVRNSEGSTITVVFKNFIGSSWGNRLKATLTVRCALK